MSETYKTRYIQKSKISNLLFENGKKLHVAGDARDALYRYLDDSVEKAMKKLIESLPRKAKGEHKGELKTHTIKLEHIEALSESE